MQNERKIFGSHISDKELISKMYWELLQPIEKEKNINNLLLKMGKGAQQIVLQKKTKKQSTGI